MPSRARGVAPHDANSNVDFTNGDVHITDDCHRSSLAYSRLVHLPGQSASIAKEAATGPGTTAYADIACSGAITPSITSAAVDRPPTTCDVLYGCIVTLTDCVSSRYLLTRHASLVDARLAGTG